MNLLVLDSATKTIELLLSSAPAATQPDFTAHFADVDPDDSTDKFVEGSNDGVLNGVTAVTAISAPASGERRIIREITVYNADTATVELTVQLNNGTDVRIIKKTTIAAGENWALSDGVASSGGSGTGDVVGPASAVDERIAVFDGTTGKLIKDGGKTVADVLDRANHTGTQEANTVTVKTIGSPTYDDVQDMINAVGSAGKFTGGDFTDNGDGTVSVAAGTGVIRATNSDTAEILFLDWSANASVALTDSSANYIYVEYNAGSPQIAVATSAPSDKNTNILLGMVYRVGTDLHMVDAGQVVSNSFSNMFWKDINIGGKFQRASGMLISEKSDRKFALTAGVFYAGITRETTNSFDTSVADTFDYYYRDGSGGHTKVTSQTQIDNTHYDDGSGTLATLSSGTWGGSDKYGVHWVYLDVDTHVSVVYGQGDYTLAEAKDAQPPSDIPDLLTEVAGLVGKIIIQKDDTAFTSIQSTFAVQFSPSAVTSHNELSNIQGGAAEEYYHLTEDEHTSAAIANRTLHNYIINGAMQVAQQGASETGITATKYPDGGPDLFKLVISSAGTWTYEQVTTGTFASDGFANSMKLSCTTAKATLGASDYLYIQHRLAGQDLDKFKKGTANAEKFQFWIRVRGYKAGTYIAELQDLDNARSVSVAFTLSAADTNQFVKIEFPADATGAFDNDNSASLALNIWLAAGSDYTSGTLQTTWGATTDANRAVGQVNAADSTSNYFESTAWGLYVGDNLPSEYDVDETLITLKKVQWLKRVFNGNGSSVFPFSTIFMVNTSTSVRANLTFSMRVVPTISHNITTWNVIGQSLGTLGTTLSIGAVSVADEDIMILNLDTSGATVGNMAYVYGEAGKYIKLDAQL